MGNPSLRTLAILALILAAAASRVIPHPYNFSPIGAIALFGAACFNRTVLAVLVPLVAVWISDIWLNNFVYNQHYQAFTLFDQGWYWMYGTYAAIAVLGLFTLKKISAPRIIGSSLAASVIFFLVTNLACWPGSAIYPQDAGGLLMCYAAGLPFFSGTLLGDLFYSGVLFGGFALLQQRFPALRAVQAQR